MTLYPTKSAPRRSATRDASGLVTGDRLTQKEFHRRYKLTPEAFKAELIGGVVHVASPTRYPHGRFTHLLGALMGAYEVATPGVEGAGNVTTILGDESEPQPDLFLRLLPEYGGQTREDKDRYLVGPPELIIEVAHSTEALDLHAKREDYRKAGVREYAVFRVGPGVLRVFDLERGTETDVGADATFRSAQFPGLWISVGALAAEDMRGLVAAGQAGLASAEHARFVARLSKRLKPPRAARPRRRP